VSVEDFPMAVLTVTRPPPIVLVDDATHNELNEAGLMSPALVRKETSV
jgi:hypothetical protein